MVDASEPELQFKNRKRLCSSWVQGLLCALPAEGFGLVPCQEKSPRLRIQVQSIVEAVRADRRSRSGTSDSAIFHRFLLHKSRTALPIQEGNTPALPPAPHLDHQKYARLGQLGEWAGDISGEWGPSLGTDHCWMAIPQTGLLCHLLCLLVSNPAGRIKSLWVF